jgi:hypothetical protein
MAWMCGGDDHVGGLAAQHLGYAALGLLPSATAALLGILAAPWRRRG